MVDSWVTWFDTIATQHPYLRCYEVPVIATRWSPGRPARDVATAGEPPPIEQFEFEFDATFRPMLALIGVTPGTAHVTLTLAEPERFVSSLRRRADLE